jgi:NAD(P)H-quinone oxidoreductase subunit 4L
VKKKINNAPMIPLSHFLIISAALFSIGLAIIITKKNAIVVFMGIELMLNAVNINLIAASRFDPDLLQGQIFAFFIIVVAAAEAAVGLAIILRVYQYFQTADLQEINRLKD